MALVAGSSRLRTHLQKACLPLHIPQLIMTWKGKVAVSCHVAITMPSSVNVILV